MTEPRRFAHPGAVERAAVVFPPQWDPRVPPLGVPVLAGHLRRLGVATRVFDANLALYRRLAEVDPAAAAVCERLGQPPLLTTPDEYSRLAGLFEDRLTEILAADRWRLGFSQLSSPLSPDRSSDWRLALEQPHRVPFSRYLRGILGDLNGWAPGLVAISVLGDTQVIAALSLAAELRRRLPEATILLGGQAFRARRTLLGRLPWLFDVVDGVGVGDGEPLLTAWLTGADRERVPNLVWRDAKGVHIPDVLQPHRFGDGDAPDFSDMLPADYLSPVPVVPIETARGCPWSQCTFCNRPDHRLPLAERSQTKPLALVARELSAAQALGAQNVAFVDEAMSGQRLRDVAALIEATTQRTQDRVAEAGCSAMDDRHVAPALDNPAAAERGGPRAVASPAGTAGSPLPWYAYARADDSHDINTMCAAARAGCRKLFVGVETGSARLLEACNKGTTPERIAATLGAASAAGISLHLFLMTGFVGETDVDRDATARLLADCLPGGDGFGLTYDVFPAMVEIGTPWFAQMAGGGAAFRSVDGACSDAVEADVDRLVSVGAAFDLCYRFRPVDPAATDAMLAATELAWREVIERACGTVRGLRHLRLGQDAMHVVFLAARAAVDGARAGWNGRIGRTL